MPLGLKELNNGIMSALVGWAGGISSKRRFFFLVN